MLMVAVITSAPVKPQPVTGPEIAVIPTSFGLIVNSYAPWSGVVVLRRLPIISSVTAGNGVPTLFTATEVGSKLPVARLE